MKRAMKLTTAGIAALALSGAIAGTAAAVGNAGARQAAVQAVRSEPTGPDTDAIQQGDQTSPDPVTAAAAAARHRVNGGDGEQEATSEQEANSDGPGGHADPAGDIQHEFDGVE